MLREDRGISTSVRFATLGSRFDLAVYSCVFHDATRIGGVGAHSRQVSRQTVDAALVAQLPLLHALPGGGTQWGTTVRIRICVDMPSHRVAFY